MDTTSAIFAASVIDKVNVLRCRGRKVNDWEKSKQASVSGEARFITIHVNLGSLQIYSHVAADRDIMSRSYKAVFDLVRLEYKALGLQNYDAVCRAYETTHLQFVQNTF